MDKGLLRISVKHSFSFELSWIGLQERSGYAQSADDFLKAVIAQEKAEGLLSSQQQRKAQSAADLTPKALTLRAQALWQDLNTLRYKPEFHVFIDEKFNDKYDARLWVSWRKRREQWKQDRASASHEAKALLFEISTLNMLFIGMDWMKNEGVTQPKNEDAVRELNDIFARLKP